MLFFVLFGVGLALAIEFLCCLFRFGFGLRSREIQRRWGGIRIHHGYVGVVFLLGAFLGPSAAQGWLLSTAAALIVSDLFHHFVVLRIWTGRWD